MVRQTRTAQFSLVLAAVQRTERLPGGEIRGLPGGRAISGVAGLQTFAVQLAEAEKEYQQGRFRSAYDRVKYLEAKFNASAGQWNARVGSLVADIRQGKQLKNLEKLKDLKAAQISMQRLISPTQKAFQDLATSLDQDSMLQLRESEEAGDGHGE